MGERKVISKYYPPDFDPAKVPRGKKADLNMLKVRMMLPMSIRCGTCGTFMAKVGVGSFYFILLGFVGKKREGGSRGAVWCKKRGKWSTGGPGKGKLILALLTSLSSLPPSLTRSKPKTKTTGEQVQHQEGGRRGRDLPRDPGKA